MVQVGIASFSTTVNDRNQGSRHELLADTSTVSYRILLVEDEGLVRLTLAETLEDAGYLVTEAISGDAAHILLQDHGFDLLLTDIQMPGSADGIAVAQRFHQLYPKSPVVFMTGRPDILSRMGQLSPGEALLRKPFRAGEMLEALASMLRKVA